MGLCLGPPQWDRPHKGDSLALKVQYTQLLGVSPVWPPAGGVSRLRGLRAEGYKVERFGLRFVWV